MLLQALIDSAVAVYAAAGASVSVSQFSASDGEGGVQRQRQRQRQFAKRRAANNNFLYKSGGLEKKRDNHNKYS